MYFFQKHNAIFGLISDAVSWAEYESCEESDGGNGNGSGDEGCGEQYDTTLPSRHTVSRMLVCFYSIVKI